MWSRVHSTFLPAGQLSFLIRAGIDYLPTPVTLAGGIDATLHANCVISPHALSIVNYPELLPGPRWFIPRQIHLET